ncbi:MAG TPA: hypothetical protein VLB50_13050 [Ignavibacteriaceae bacterium]|nr:hypothetical protein [Ignavibacteriaceae bacterium]
MKELDKKTKDGLQKKSSEFNRTSEYAHVERMIKECMDELKELNVHINGIKNGLKKYDNNIIEDLEETKSKINNVIGLIKLLFEKESLLEKK